MTKQPNQGRSPRFRRRRSVIRPTLQLKVSAIFVCVLVVTLALFAAQLHSATRNLSVIDSQELQVVLGKIIMSKLLASLALGAALTIGVAVAVTFRIAGPIYRMHAFLTRVRDGQQREPCRLRKGDSFEDLCQIINEVTEPLRAADLAVDDDGPKARDRESALAEASA